LLPSGFFTDRPLRSFAMPQKAPFCPWCAKLMVHKHTTPTAKRDSRKHQYECRRCIVVYTELERDGERLAGRVRKLDRQQINTLH
jgi:hypothetical protein